MPNLDIFKKAYDCENQNKGKRLIKTNLTNKEHSTCKELIKDKIFCIKIEIHHCEMYIEEAINHKCERTEEKQRKLMEKFLEEKIEIETLYKKFN